MSHWLTAFVLLLPLSALAAPEDHVGDYVKFRVTGAGSDFWKKYVVKKYDPRKRAYLVESAVAAEGQDPQLSQTWIPAPNLYTREQGKQDVANCANLPGKPESFSLNGQEYEVCRHYFYETKAYELVGPFPIFGRARLVGSGEEDTTEELVDFLWAR